SISTTTKKRRIEEKRHVICAEEKATGPKSVQEVNKLLSTGAIREVHGDSHVLHFHPLSVAKGLISIERAGSSLKKSANGLLHKHVNDTSAPAHQELTHSSLRTVEAWTSLLRDSRKRPPWVSRQSSWELCASATSL
uniref:Uncharacterized protein n=1 Tax=Haemonchus contortus TaxID=6289 RepID=A0A912MRP5_HAECO